MAAPNVAAPTAVKIKTKRLVLTTSNQDLYSTSDTTTGHNLQVEAIWVTGTDTGGEVAFVTAEHVVSSTGVKISYSQRVNPKQTVNLLLGRPLNLEESQSFRMKLESGSGDAEVISSYSDVT